MCMKSWGRQCSASITVGEFTASKISPISTYGCKWNKGDCQLGHEQIPFYDASCE